MKAEEERNTAEAVLSLRVDNLLKYYTDLAHEQHLRRQERLQDEANESSRGRLSKELGNSKCSEHLCFKAWKQIATIATKF